MADPIFTLTAGEGLHQLVGVERTALAGAVLEFTCNLTPGELLALDGGLDIVDTVRVKLDNDGKINGDTGVDLLADDPSLNLEHPLQWRVKITGAKANGFPKAVTAWSFEAPGDGETAALDSLAHVPGQSATGSVRVFGPILANDVTDSGAAGRDVLRSDTASEARTALDVFSTSEARYVVNLWDWDDIRDGQWHQSVSGASFTSGQFTLSNPSRPFTSADVGKLVIVNETPDGGGFFTRWMATIVDVSSGVAELDVAAPSSGSGLTVTWGFDVTDALNDALAEVAADSESPRDCYLWGRYRASQIVQPNRVYLRGSGWGNYTASTWTNGNTHIKQLPGSECDLWVFDGGLADGRYWAGPAGVSHINLIGPELNVTGLEPTVGSGFAVRRADGTPVTTQDGFACEWVHAAGFPEHGFHFSGGGVPLTVTNFRAFYNGGYGVHYYNDPASGQSTTQAVHFLGFSGDGNALGLLHFQNVANRGGITITNLKSEAHADDGVWPRGVEPSGDDLQMDAVILEDCDNTPVTINGITHLYGGGAKGPGPAIHVKSTTTKRPKITYSGIAVRVTGGESGSIADAVTLRDDVVSRDVARTEVRGTWPPDYPRLAGAADTRGNKVWETSEQANSVNYVQIKNAAATATPGLVAAGDDTNIGVVVVPKAGGGFEIYAASGQDARVVATGADASHNLNLQSKASGVVKANGVEVVTLTGTQTLTNKTLTTPRVSSVYDSNGNAIIGFNAVASAVNYVQISNRAAGVGDPGLTAAGSDTNISVNLATKGTGIVKANSVEVATISGSQTLTNKRITARIGTTASSATPTINTDTVDQFNVTALAEAITSMTTNLSGTPADGQRLRIRFKDDGTGRAIAWGASFVGNLLATTVATKTHIQELVYDSAAAKWAGTYMDAAGY